MDSNTPFYFRSKRGRHGVSPVIATVIILAITVALGLGLWSFVNGQVGTSTQSFANDITDYVNYVNDRYVLVNMAFNYDASKSITSPPCPAQCASVWIYNNGNVPVNVTGVFFGASSSSQPQVNFWFGSVGNNFVPNKFLIAPKTMGVLSFDSGSAFTPSTYYVKIVSVTGTFQTYFQKNG